MLRTATAALVIGCSLASMSHAGECADMGLDNAFLQSHFCEQLQALTPGTGVTRSITQEGNPDLPDESFFAEFPMFQDAYRADPRKTLELIERIKGAGGLPVENN